MRPISPWTQLSPHSTAYLSAAVTFYNGQLPPKPLGFLAFQSRRNLAWEKMGSSTFLALILAIGVQLFFDPVRDGIAPALAYSSIVLLLWLLSPLIVGWINRPIIEHPVPLNEEQEKLLRQVTRRTWGFFERFVGPEDHWLPPDHYQESPVGTIAHRTSPTNIGLLLTSTLAAYDLGYLDPTRTGNPPDHYDGYA